MEELENKPKVKISGQPETFRKKIRTKSEDLNYLKTMGKRI